MNYTELREANDLLKKLIDTDLLIKNIEEENYVTIACFGFNVTLVDRQKDKVLEILTSTRYLIARRLKELGIVEG